MNAEILRRVVRAIAIGSHVLPEGAFPLCMIRSGALGRNRQKQAGNEELLRALGRNETTL